MAISDSIRSTLANLWGFGWGASSGVVMRTAILPGSKVDYSHYAGQLWLNSVVALSLQWKGERLPLAMMRQSKIAKTKTSTADVGDYVPMGSSDLVDLWSRPNDRSTRMDFEPSVAMSLDLDGNAYVLKLRNGYRQVKQLQWLPHHRVAPVAKGNELIGYAIDGMISKDLPIEDVIHFRRGCDPNNPWVGISALKAQLRQVATDNEAATFTASIMRNMGVAGTVITPDDPALRPNPEDAKSVKKAFDSVTMGDSRGGTVVLLGKYKVSQPGFSPEQLCLKDLPLDAAGRIAGSLGTPLMVLGMRDPDKTYANLESAIRTAWDSIKAVQRIIANGLRYGLLPDFGVDPHANAIEYIYDEIQECQESLDSLWKRLGVAYKDGLLMRGEGRELLGLPRVAGDDCWYPGTGGLAEPVTTQNLRMQETSPVTGALTDATAPQALTAAQMQPGVTTGKPPAPTNGKPKVPVPAGKG